MSAVHGGLVACLTTESAAPGPMPLCRKSQGSHNSHGQGPKALKNQSQSTTDYWHLLTFADVPQMQTNSFHVHLDSLSSTGLGPRTCWPIVGY